MAHTPAQKTINHIKELAKGTSHDTTLHIKELEDIEMQHANYPEKQVVFCGAVLDDFIQMMMRESQKRMALWQARYIAVNKNYGNQTMRESILRLTSLIAPN